MEVVGVIVGGVMVAAIKVGADGWLLKVVVDGEGVDSNRWNWEANRRAGAQARASRIGRPNRQA